MTYTLGKRAASTCVAFAASLLFALHASPAVALDSALDWPNFYGPEVILDLHIKIKKDDWDEIRVDDTYDIEVPVLFWTANEGEGEAVLVSIRRKSATPIGTKVSFKIDINEYEGEDIRAVGKWHKLKKLSLENGDDQDVVREGLAWYLHRLATSPTSQIYPVGHTPGLANWVTITAHVVPSNQGEFEFLGAETVEPQGVYVNLEQPDKQFLKNREIYESDQTWLYKQDDIGLPERKEVGCEDINDEGDSPTVELLQCSPFLAASGKGKKLFVPPDCTATEMNDLINMDIMLAQAAVEAFSSNSDGMFTHVKNFYWTDRSDAACDAVLEGTKRKHFPWDLDAAIASTDANIYSKSKKRRRQDVKTEYQRVILGEASFRDIYNGKLDTIVDIKYIDDAIAYLDLMEPDLTPLLQADPNSKVDGAVGEHFDGMRNWLQVRATNVADQICADDAGLC